MLSEANHLHSLGIKFVSCFQSFDCVLLQIVDADDKDIIFNQVINHSLSSSVGSDIVLSYGYGLSVRKTAEIVGCGVSTVQRAEKRTSQR